MAVLSPNVSAAISARCLLRVAKSFGLMFSNLSGPADAQVSYFTRVGLPSDGKQLFLVGVWIDPGGKNGGHLSLHTEI